MQNDIIFNLKKVSRLYRSNPIHFYAEDSEGEFSIPRGGMIAILGGSGCGKTTLLNLLATMDRNREGGCEEIKYYNPDGSSRIYSQMTPADRTELRCKHFGFIFQNDELIDFFNVHDNIELPFWLLQKSVEPEKLEEMLEQIGLSAPYLASNPADLSVGMASRVALLRAISASPCVIFADEPTANLDFARERQVLKFLKDWSKKENAGAKVKNTVLLSTHKIKLALEFCDYFIILPEKSSKGHINVITKKRNQISGDESEIKEILNYHESQPHLTEINPDNLPKQPIPKTLWNIIFRDFWRHPRSEKSLRNSMLARIVPLLFVVSFFILVFCSSLVWGVKAGSEDQYQKAMEDEFLWTAEIRGSYENIEKLKGSLKDMDWWDIRGFYRTIAFVYPSFTEYHTPEKIDSSTNIVVLRVRAMQNSDPLLNKIFENIIWPADENEKVKAVQRFLYGDWGIIISEDALVSLLGFADRNNWPQKLCIGLEGVRERELSIIAVTKEVPDGHIIINKDFYKTFIDPFFRKEHLKHRKFNLFPVGEYEPLDRRAVVQDWLIDCSIPVDTVEYYTGIAGKPGFNVFLKKEVDEAELLAKMKMNWESIHDLIEDPYFTRDSDIDFNQQFFNSWSVLFKHKDALAIDTLINLCYAQKELFIDTSVRSRVQSLEKGHGIFKVMAYIVLGALFLFGILILFSTTWFDSVRKTRAVGVMLGLGTKRRIVLLAYLIQSIILMLSFLMLFVLLDIFGVFNSLTAWLNNTFLSSDIIYYSGWSTLWLCYLGLLIVIIIAVGLMRLFIYGMSPASLINFRD